jgi:23S rRNA pseudouridine2605 synthase
MMDDPAKGPSIRVQVAIAHAGIASRRGAEELMCAGRVKVNGQICTELGTRIGPLDRLEVDGKPVGPEESKVYIALNKPRGYICTLDDQYGRPLAASLLKPEIHERVYNVGRLDLESSGLIFFTNDGIFAAKAGHPRHGLIKEYAVTTDNVIHRTFARQFEQGLEESGELLKARRVELTSERTLTVWLSEGKNREIRRALALFGLHAILLQRTAIGPVRLGDLAEGHWRRLSQSELDELGQVFKSKEPGHPVNTAAGHSASTEA